MALNLVTLSGRLGRQPDPKYFESGTVVAKFSIAVDKNTSKKDEPPHWIDCEAWGKTAEVLCNYTDKGSLVGLSGSFYSETWEDKATGAKRTKHVLKVDNVTLLGSKGDRQQSAPAGGTTDYGEIDF